ncbi:MAG: nucleoside hydrolase [Candidatus Limnocylindrales bacterium]
MTRSIPGRIPLILDVDTGIDDALALLYAAAAPEIELLAATCVAGNIDAQNVARNTAAVLDLAGRGDVEVALGAVRPLLRPLRTTPETHGPRGLGYADPPPAERPLSPRAGADLLVEEARRHPGRITLVATGPLTNVALACLREPAFPTLLRRLVLMGGAYRTPGNTTPVSEWNIAVDPEAARVVFDAFSPDHLTPLTPEATPDPSGPSASPSPRTSPSPTPEPDGPEPYRLPLCFGLDVTETAILTPDHLERLWAKAGARPEDDPLLGCIDEALRFYFEFHAQYDGFYGAHVHDPLALAGAVHPELVTRSETVTVDIETAGQLTSGQTVTDWRHHWGRPANAEIVLEADVPAFLDRWIERVADLARTTRAGRSGR